MRILVTGDRDYDNSKYIHDWIHSLDPNIVIIEGGAAGADNLAQYYAKGRGMDVLTFKAKWKEFGKAAGPIRNQEMLDEGQPDEIHAFHDHLDKSKGTRDMIKRGLKAGLPVYLHADGKVTKLELKDKK